MVETRFQSASNEVTSLASDSLEDGEVPPIVLPITGDDLVALQTQQLILSAAQLGFTNAQVEAFLNSITSEPATMPEPKIHISSPPYVQDPSLSKMPENNIYDLRRFAQDKFTSTTKKNKDQFDFVLWPERLAHAPSSRMPTQQGRLSRQWFSLAMSSRSLKPTTSNFGVMT